MDVPAYASITVMELGCINFGVLTTEFDGVDVHMRKSDHISILYLV